MDERKFWLAFSAFPGVGPVRFKLLLDFFGSAKKAYQAGTKDLLKINFGEKLTANFDKFRREFSIEAYAKKLKDSEINFLILTDEKYPKLLKEIPDPPFVLYIKGKRKNDKIFERSHLVQGETLISSAWDISKAIAVVGTRRITNYGREVTRLIVGELVASGLTIVSGLAIGVDAAAHEAALDAGGSPRASGDARRGEAGKTIAVLGCGVDCCYPRANQNLYNKIIDGNGVVVSEMPLSHQPSRGLFPARNRIISGLSLGVLVVEGAGDSGALITARNAAEQGREVFAVPGPITSPYSAAPAQLIRKGAKLVTNAGDILEELNIKGIGYRVKGRVKEIEGTPEEEKILQILEGGELHFDEIVRRSQMETAKIGSLLSIMEIKGMVRSLGGGVFSAAS